MGFKPCPLSQRPPTVSTRRERSTWHRLFPQGSITCTSLQGFRAQNSLRRRPVRLRTAATPPGGSDATGSQRAESAGPNAVGGAVLSRWFRCRLSPTWSAEGGCGGCRSPGWWSMDPVAAHSCHLLQQLHEQRIQGLLCDCMLVVKGVCFKAHKNVLAAFSQYFRSLFQNSSGQKNDVFHLDIKNVSGIGQILDFMYTSHLDLNQDNIQVMLDTAQCLQVQNVLNLCHTFLKSATVDQPPGLPCHGTFSLQGTLTPDTNCVLNENYPPHLLPECSAGVQQGRAVDESHSHVPASVGLHPPTAETSKQAPDPFDGSCTELPFKQPNCYYKLRNLYSKQYYKHAGCPSHERVTEQPFTFSASTDLHAADRQPCAVSHTECVLESSQHLPSNFLAQPLGENAPDPTSDHAGQQPTRQMRLKKAVHLKKLNFLKSQKSAEQTSEPKPDDSLTKRLEAAREHPVEKVNSPSAEEKESEELSSSENLNGVSEMERPEDPSALEDQTQMPQSQRQYACELCGKPFKHPSNLELHRRSHTGTLIWSPQAEGKEIIPDDQTPLPAPVFVRSFAIA